MLSTKHAQLAIKILALLLIGAISFFWLTSWLPETKFIQESLESVENSKDTVMALSGATLSSSLAISALPDDFATPLANNLSDMNSYFIAILAVLVLEKILIEYGIEIAFSILIPWACAAGAIGIFLKNNILKGFAIRLSILALAAAFVVPCSTYMSKHIANELEFNSYIEETINETEDGSNKLNQAMNEGGDEKNIFDKLSDLFLTAIKGITDLMDYFQGIIRKCMNSIAILILTNCIMPILTFLVLKWILRETFNIAIPNIPVKTHHHHHHDKFEHESEHEHNEENKLAVIGEKNEK